MKRLRFNETLAILSGDTIPFFSCSTKQSERCWQPSTFLTTLSAFTLATAAVNASVKQERRQVVALNWLSHRKSMSTATPMVDPSFARAQQAPLSSKLTRKYHIDRNAQCTLPLL